MSTTDSRRPFPVVRILLWVLLAVAGVGLWLLSLRGPDLPRAWRALLVNFLFFTSLGGGLVVWPAAVRACNGRWHTGIERLAASGIAFALPSLAALVVLWIGSPAWSPWYQMRYHQGLWLDNAFLFGRDLAALAIFWSVALVYLLRRREGEARYCGPILVLVYSVVFSLLGFDLVMSLDPLWKSNLAGGYFFITALYIAMICWGLLASLHPDTGPDQRQDLGKLVYAFAMMTIYLMYAHLNLMYYENLPHEVRFLIPRMHNSSWKPVSYLVLFLPYFGPLLMLLGIKVKRNRWTLGLVCVLLLIGMWVERWWLVAPTFETRVSLGLSEVSMAACCLGLLGLGMELFHRWIPQSYLQGEQQK